MRIRILKTELMFVQGRIHKFHGIPENFKKGGGNVKVEGIIDKHVVFSLKVGKINLGTLRIDYPPPHYEFWILIWLYPGRRAGSRGISGLCRLRGRLQRGMYSFFFKTWFFFSLLFSVSQRSWLGQASMHVRLGTRFKTQPCFWMNFQSLYFTISHSLSFSFFLFIT